MKRSVAVVLVLLIAVSAVPALGATDGEPTGFLRMVAQYFQLRFRAMPTPSVGNEGQISSSNIPAPSGNRNALLGRTALEGGSCLCGTRTGNVVIAPPVADPPECTCCETVQGPVRQDYQW